MLDWIFPQTVEVVNSPINGQIKVVKSRGQFSVWVGGFQQSGPLVEKVWQKAIKNLTLPHCKDVLILGFGCGSAAKLIHQKWPKAKIVGVELDPAMKTIARKYFQFSSHRSIKILIEDAHKYAEEATRTKKHYYDLILIDAYLGNKAKPLPGLKALLSTEGLIIRNELIGTRNRLITSGYN